MFKLKPIVVVLGACLVQACAAPWTQQEMAMRPVLQVRHSSDQLAATYYQLGKYHHERGDLELARAAYIRSIELDRRHLEARNALASIHSQQGRLDEAKSLLLQLVADYPGVAHPYNNLGYVYFIQGNLAAAETTLERALLLAPGNDRARNNLAAVRAALARNSEGNGVASGLVPNMREAKATVPNAEALNRKVADAATENIKPSLAIPPALKLDVAAASPVPPQEREQAGIQNPPSAPQARMEVVQVVPNVFDLKLKTPVATNSAQLLAAETLVAREAPASSTRSKTSRVEIANGNGVTGMARRIRNVLGQHGIAVSQLTNDLPYKQQITKIQYRAGYEQEAKALKNALRGFAALVPVSTLSGNSHIRLVLGKDAIGQLALIEGSTNGVHLALNETPN